MYHLNLKLFSPTYLPRDFILGIYWTLYLVSVDLQMIAENFVHIHMQYTQYIYILALIKSISPEMAQKTKSLVQVQDLSSIPGSHTQKGKN